MPGKKKPFIDKKNAVTFHLVHRSQRDPLQASEEASKHVLLPSSSKKDLDKRKEEQKKYGVFFDDDYDYMQHLRDVNEAYELQPVDDNRTSKGEATQKIQLPSTVFASEVETDVGLLNQAAPISGPKLNWDPDIVAALDDDFEFSDPENQLEDDFVQLANTEGDMDEEELGSDEECDVGSNEADMSDDGMDDYYGDQRFMDEETKSRFTNYSMSSSVIRRNEGLTLLDDRFEKFYEQFDDTEIGALDHEDIEGAMDQNSYMLNTILEEYEKEQDAKKLKDVVDESEGDDVDVKSEESDTEADLIEMMVEEDPKEKWDCESILSTYSNLYNHPKLIEEPKKERKIELTARLGIPNESIEKPGLSRKQIEQARRADRLADRASTYRPKDETSNEKKDRKKAIKEERKERRLEKKENKKAFTKEKIRQEKELKNLKNNLQGVKIV